MISKKQIAQNREIILGKFSGIKRQGIDGLVGFLNESNFFVSPASTKFHGNFEGGLASHSYQVYEEFSRKVDQYALKVLEESRFIAGICHDLCKVNLYVPNLLKSKNVSEAKPYKIEDNFPIGHGEKSVMLVQRYMQLTEREAVLVRWHMGHFDKSYVDYQDSIEKMFPECVLFQHADKEISLMESYHDK